jgi:membrane protein DedA with SNARE-associated domain
MAVLLGGVAASQGQVPLAGAMAAGIGGAVAGDAIGYLVGRRWGRRILDSTLGRFVKPVHLDRAERALAHRAVGAVFLGRFSVALRVMIPGLAGMAHMPYWRFAIANIAGGVVWGAAIAVAGYLAGNSWHAVAHDISAVGIGVTLGVVALLLLARGIHRRRSRARDKNGPGPAADGCSGGEQVSEDPVEAPPSTLAREIAQPA